LYCNILVEKERTRQDGEFYSRTNEIYYGLEAQY